MKLEELELAEREHQAWRRWCEEFEELAGASVEHPAYRKFIALTRIWGERLATLRSGRESEHSTNVIREEETNA